MALIYQVPTMGEAEIRAALVERGMADLLVHRVLVKGQARGDALWYITKIRQEATSRVWFGSIGMSQVKICFVDSYGEAGWCRPHPLQGQLG